MNAWSDPDLAELAEPHPRERPIDAVSLALGSATFVRSHRFGDLHVPTPAGRSPRLAVSRYYWELEPPVVVDFRREIRRGPAEVAAKRAYCARYGIHYVLASDEWDEEAVRRVVRAPARADDPETADDPQSPPARPLTAPRRKRT